MSPTFLSRVMKIGGRGQRGDYTFYYSTLKIVFKMGICVRRFDQFVPVEFSVDTLPILLNFQKNTILMRSNILAYSKKKTVVKVQKRNSNFCIFLKLDSSSLVYMQSAVLISVKISSSKVISHPEHSSSGHYGKLTWNHPHTLVFLPTAYVVRDGRLCFHFVRQSKPRGYPGQVQTGVPLPEGGVPLPGNTPWGKFI